MLELIITGLTLGFTAAGIGMYLIEITNFGAILGWIRFRISLIKASESDVTVFDSIISDEKLNASQRAEAMNEQFYWHIAKHSRLMFAILCKYCTGTWVLAFCLITFFLCFHVEQFKDSVCIVLLSIASLFFTLKLSK